VAAHAKATYGFIILLMPAVNEPTEETVNDESSKFVHYVVYSKGHIARTILYYCCLQDYKGPVCIGSRLRIVTTPTGWLVPMQWTQ
jgi:hypothetical protein